MKKIFIAILGLFAFSKVQSQIVISGYHANPSGVDGNYEYVQLVATQNINFANTPYTLIVNNNGTAGANGWAQGGATTYAIEINTGTVSTGDVFYVGGIFKLLNGATTLDISGLTWLANKDFTQAGDGGIGQANASLGNGGTSADGIGIFVGAASSIDSTSDPIDAVFFGLNLGSSYIAASGAGYNLPSNDLYNGNFKFGQDTNTFRFSDPLNGGFSLLSGTYNISTNTWTTPRTLVGVPLTSTSTQADIASQIVLASNNPTITTNTGSFTNDFGTTSPGNASASSNFTISGSNLSDTVKVYTNSPFQIRNGSNNFSNDTIYLVPSNGSLINEQIDAVFNPSTAGNFSDSIFIISNGANTVKIPVTGISIANPQLSFDVASVNLAEETAGVYKVIVRIVNPNATPTDVTVSLGSETTGSNGTDFNFISPNTITFPASSTDSIALDLEILDDNIVQYNEKIFIVLSNPTNSATLDIDTLVINLTDNDYMPVNIADIRGINGLGVADSLGKRFEVRGVTYGNNLRITSNPSSAGLQFTIIDNTGGVGVFAGTNPFGYNYQEGDSIIVRGTLEQFRGLAQLGQIDTIILLASNRTLKTPTQVLALGENTESDLVRINGVRMLNPGIWNVSSASGFNFSAVIEATNDTIQIRVATDLNSLNGTTQPTGSFDIIGLGGQFDASSPLTSGYQLFPRGVNDIIIPADPQDTLAAFNLLFPVDGFSATINGDGAQTVNITWGASIPAQGINAPFYEFLLAPSVGTFSTPLATIPSNNTGADTVLTVTYQALADLMSGAGLPVGGTFNGIWTVRATANGFTRYANDTFAINLTRGVINSIQKVSSFDGKVYPNPSNGIFKIESNEEINSIQVLDITGRVIKQFAFSNNKNIELNISDLNKGTYIIFVGNETNVKYFRISLQ